MPPGPYQVILRLLRQSDEQPVAAADGMIDHTLTEHLILSPQHSARSPQPAALRFSNGVDLFDYTLPDVVYRPGHLVPVTVYWQVRETPPVEMQLRLQLLDGEGQLVSETLGPPTRADYPASQWQPGQFLMGQAALTVPALVDKPPYTVQLALLTPAGEPVRAGWRRTVTLGEITPVPWPLVTELPPLATPFVAEFGEPVLATLHGYELSATEGRPGEVLELELVGCGKRHYPPITPFLSTWWTGLNSLPGKGIVPR
ncbi:MAG: hypothetical protein IPL78_29550 [Chloroflexi bacterium]|nr:hypothetical protein [Chloroflexota bacterium]